MTLKNQFNVIKDNWLLALLVLAMFGYAFLSSGGNSFQSFSSKSVAYDGGYAMAESAMYSSRYYPVYDDFAPEVENRKITRTASLSSEVKYGEYDSAERKLKDIVSASDSLITYENTYTNERNKIQYKSGSYTIKLTTDKYDSIVSQLKEIGEVTSFNENANDITGQYVSVEDQLEIARERLSNYQDMLNDANMVSDKITLVDMISNQQSTIKYLEDRLANLDNRVEYTTVTVSLSEKPGNYASIALVKFSELVKGLVNSFNLLLYLIFAVLPWAAALAIILAIRKVVKRK